MTRALFIIGVLCFALPTYAQHETASDIEDGSRVFRPKGAQHDRTALGRVRVGIGPVPHVRTVERFAELRHRPGAGDFLFGLLRHGGEDPAKHQES